MQVEKSELISLLPHLFFGGKAKIKEISVSFAASLRIEFTISQTSYYLKIWFSDWRAHEHHKTFATPDSRSETEEEIKISYLKLQALLQKWVGKYIIAFNYNSEYENYEIDISDHEYLFIYPDRKYPDYDNISVHPINNGENFYIWRAKGAPPRLEFQTNFDN